jgi:hypothetical protein
MNKASIFRVAAVLVMATVFPAQAADRLYPIAYVQKVEVTEPSDRTAWEDKDFLNCDDVVLTEEDVRYALRHMRRVSWKAYAPENGNTVGCKGGALVTFKNGRAFSMGIEPTGRISTAEYDAKMNSRRVPRATTNAILAGIARWQC